MYLVFKSVNKSVANSHVYGVEFCNSTPTFVTSDSDLIYVDIQDGQASTVKEKVDVMLANIDETTINVAVSGRISCDLSNIIVSGSSPSRKIDPEDWKSTVRPAWYRVAAYTDYATI